MRKSKERNIILWAATILRHEGEIIPKENYPEDSLSLWNEEGLESPQIRWLREARGRGLIILKYELSHGQEVREIRYRIKLESTGETVCDTPATFNALTQYKIVTTEGLFKNLLWQRRLRNLFVDVIYD